MKPWHLIPKDDRDHVLSRFRNAVAAFLDALDDAHAPAWLDAPDGPGHWHERFPDGSTSLTRVEKSGDYLYERASDGEHYPLESTSRWQRVAPPREG